MKKTIIKITTRKESIIFLLLLLLFSCNKKNDVDLLKEAQNIVESDPSKAMLFLDSIPNPQDMDKEHYMQYIVAHIQSKDKCYKDITEDTLIFEAQKYFEKSNNHTQAALANLYAGNVYYEKEMLAQALRYYLQAKKHSIQTSNNLITGRIFLSIGHLYLGKSHKPAIEGNYREIVPFFMKDIKIFNILNILTIRFF